MEKSTQKYSHNAFPYLDCLVFVLLFIGSFVFYVERIGFSDPAFQTFLLINDGYPAIMTNRWPAICLRFLPWLAMMCGATLQWIMLFFSVSYVLFSFLCWLIISRFFHHKLLGFLWIMVLILGTSETFYWCSSDLLSSIGIGLIGLAGLDYYKNKLIGLSFFFLAVWLALFLHSLLLFPIGFVLIYKILFDSSHKKILALALVGFVILWLIKAQFYSNWYDTTKQAEFLDNLITYKYHLWQMPAFKLLLQELIPKFLLWIILLVFNTYFMLRNKHWIAWSFLVVSILLYLFIVHLGDPLGGFSFYREAGYVSISVFLVFPLLQFYHHRNFRFIYIAVIVFCMIRIYIWHGPFSDRIAYVRHCIAKSPCSKNVIAEEALDKNRLKMTWALPFESLLISTLDHNSKTLFNAQDQHMLTNPQKYNQFLGPFKQIPNSDINQSYFVLNSSHYCLIAD